ncbi:hypothetical protein FQR65_LT10246 [Abscondita terminalis]|nr:hypothetical protein FQR65_LT10246 [Abscondita terminalis]
METTDKIEPSDVNKSPKVIRVAKEEIGKLDVLVCGECHDVFYYIDEFKEHKEDKKCDGISVTRDNCKNETKPQVWAFMLWKHAQARKETDEDNLPTPWSIYQQWCKLNPKEKEGWIVAGENIQSFSKIGTAKIQEVKSNAQPVKNKLQKSNVQVIKHNSSDELLEEGEMQRRDSENDAEDESDDKVKNNNVNKKTPIKPKPVVNTLKNTKSIPTLRKALRTGKDDNIEEMIIERILGRRLNHKKKCTEYFIKWENRPDSENTWEPKIHLIKCQVLMEEFDNIIDKKKTMGKGAVKSVESQLEEMESDNARPQRTSKQKALNQVKVWCGDISEGDETPVKRKSFSDDDSTDSFEKKIKLEDDSETTDDEKPSITIRRVSKPQGSINGVAKKNSDVTLTSAQRVVRVNQKQLPNLSSGVYIMSKTEGIIKLDSNSSSAGGPLLKVGSKIGQTHIKMIKKDDSNTSKTISSRLQSADKKQLPIVQKGRGMPHRKLLSNPPLIKAVIKTNDSLSDKQIESISSNFDDDSDGLEELEFPTDLPLPEPDSPPGEFTLCPLTGKVLGETDELKEEEPSADSTSLDTLVQLAAAELPDVDIDSNSVKKEPDESKEIIPIVQTDSSEDLVREEVAAKPAVTTILSPVTTAPTTSTAATVTDLEASIKPSAIEKSTSMVLNLDPVLTSSQPKTTATSVLSTTLTNVHVLPSPNKPVVPSKKLLSTPSTVRQKVTTFQQRQTINRPAMHKPSPTSTIIHKVTPGRSKLGTSKSFQEPLIPTVKRSPNVSTYKSANVAKRIGNTTIYKTEKPTQSSVVKKAIPTSFNVPQVTPTPTPAKSAAVINMPLLTTDDDSAAIIEPATSTQQLAEIQPLPVLAADNEINDLTTFNLADSETPLLITGDDGTIYQVAGQNEEGQTILISEGPDGQQQCVIVSSECSNEEISVMMGDAQSESEQMEVDESLTINIQDPEGDSAESEESQVVAQIIKADPPSPGGSRKVVLMLPDGNLMMTNVTAEQYAALELDK